MAYPTQADPTAVFGRRVLAAVLDGLLILVPVIALVTSSFEYLSVDDLPVSADEYCDRFLEERDGFCVNTADIDDRVYFADSVDASATALYWGGTFALFVLLQGLTGWSIGKLITGIRVVREDGRPAGIVKAFLRWILWIVDAFPYFLPLVGFIVGLTTVGHRRVGDMVAKTFVVRASAAGSPIVVPGLTAPPSPPGVTGPWGGAAPGPSQPWAQPADPASAGWAAPTMPSSAPSPTGAAPAPQWDAARNTYIQWDPTQSAWMQWDEATRVWSRIPGQ